MCYIQAILAPLLEGEINSNCLQENGPCAEAIANLHAYLA